MYSLPLGHCVCISLYVHVRSSVGRREGRTSLSVCVPVLCMPTYPGGCISGKFFFIVDEMLFPGQTSH